MLNQSNAFRIKFGLFTTGIHVSDRAAESAAFRSFEASNSTCLKHDASSHEKAEKRKSIVHFQDQNWPKVDVCQFNDLSGMLLSLVNLESILVVFLKIRFER